ncbi:hypothetical protein GCM10010988_29950 [Cnuibacter physcomitrellae]|uniref:Uncharacterized protein n=1 Tax=Cnuibacter physcomitrellae TaxID=1619308 RepID=A0A1X9LK08_9MICO|nr:hypothetical protein [Cnuibacter physcomitrellae]ARJ04251.1 hypothetical protein B5808_02675 [Cnuibacter physcomitrellae]GGI40612.1 hypothetical protein GCM10010988_29950 [Cnuibacter physcomitrellae]
MPYTAQKPAPRENSDDLRARIPGWGVDLDPADRPAVPRERYAPEATGAHWDFPDRQPELHPRERSIEHGMLPPVFGTVAPLHGVSGIVRRVAYARFSEGRAAHWLLLVVGDRIDAAGAHVASLFSGRPDNPVTETGILSERRRHGWSSRVGSTRVDTHHAWIDPIIVAGPWIVGGWIALKLAGKVVRAVRR